MRRRKMQYSLQLGPGISAKGYRYFEMHPESVAATSHRFCENYFTRITIHIGPVLVTTNDITSKLQNSSMHAICMLCNEMAK